VLKSSILLLTFSQNRGFSVSRSEFLKDGLKFRGDGTLSPLFSTTRLKSVFDDNVCSDISLC